MSAPLRKALPHLMLRAGDMVGRYRIERVLHESPSAVIYRATHAMLGIPAAIKLGTRAAEIEAEAEALSLFASPHLPLLFERGILPVTQAPIPFLTMEYVEGHTLSHLLRTHRRLGPFTTIRLALQLLGALSEVHRHGIVHGDVKPDNVVTVLRADELERSVLLDFGCARGVTPPLSGTGAVGLRATPRYAAPEVHDGQAPTPASDLFSLGCLLFEAISGAVPRWGADGLAAPLSSLVPTPVGVAEVIERALRTNPAERYSNAGDFADALLSLDVASIAHFGAFEGTRVQGPQETLDTVDMTSPGAEMPLHSVPFRGVAANDDGVPLLSVDKPSVWFCAGDPGLDQDQVQLAVERLRQSYDVLVLDSSEREKKCASLTAAELPWVIVFGDLHALLEEPLLAEASQHGETSRMLVSTHENLDLLTTTINSSGLDAQLCLGSDADELVIMTHRMIERVRHVRVHYDGLRLAVRDAQEDILSLQQCFNVDNRNK